MKRATVGKPPDTGGDAAVLRRWIIEQCRDANVGHLGSALSIVEMLAVLWGDVMHRPGTDDPARDRFILGKGHAALALYAVMRLHGLIDEATYRTYCQDDSLLGVHPEHGLPGVEVTTGSLGQGLSVGCGQAIALAKRGSKARVFVLVSDGECNEGQVWEAAMLAAHHRLKNLVVMVDDNGSQAFGAARDVIDMSPMAERWRAFGWHAVEADGHDVSALRDALTTAIDARTGPAVVIAKTVLGKGVSYMEGRLEWHYRNLTPALAAQALAEVEASL